MPLQIISAFGIMQEYLSSLVNMLPGGRYMAKVRAFDKNVFININDCLFVCKYDKNRSYGYTNNSYNMNYIVVQEKDNKFYMLILSNFVVFRFYLF